jgi:hypothetical protein
MDFVLKTLKYIKDAFFWNFLVRHKPEYLSDSYIPADHFAAITRSFAEPINNCSWCKASTGNDCICGMCSTCHNHCFNFTSLGKKIAHRKGCSSTCELALACKVVSKEIE